MKNLFDNNKNIIGNKAKNLNFLYKNGFNVKPGFILTEPEQNIEIPFEKSIVRSNGIGEDGKCSYSGIFESISNVSKENLNESILKVWNSFFSKKYEAYKKIKKCEVIPGILIQEMIESKYSAVAHIYKDRFYIEHLKGSCSNIVSGKVTPLVTTNEKEFNDYQFSELISILKKIYSLYKKPQEVEMTFDGKWWILQTKDIK
jgi:pyruvate,water dikinase